MVYNITQQYFLPQVIKATINFESYVSNRKEIVIIERFVAFDIPLSNGLTATYLPNIF